MRIIFGQKSPQFGMVRRSDQTSPNPEGADGSSSGTATPTQDTFTHGHGRRSPLRPVDTENLWPPLPTRFEMGRKRKTEDTQSGSVKVFIKEHAQSDAKPGGTRAASSHLDTASLMRIRPERVVVKSRNGKDDEYIDTTSRPKDKAQTQRLIEDVASQTDREKWQFMIKAKKAGVEDKDFALDPAKIKREKEERRKNKPHAFFYEPFADVVIPNWVKLARGEGIEVR